MLKIAPESISAATWRGHNVQFIVVCDKDIEVNLPDCPWASISSRELTGNGQTTLILALEDNMGAESRTGHIEVKSVNTTISAAFTQPPLGGVYGLYNYDSNGSEIRFDELKNQSSVRRYPNGVADSRLFYPAEGKFLVFRGIPVNCKKGDRISFLLLQNWTENLGYQSDLSAECVKVEDGKLWLAEGNTVYIIKL